MQLTHQNGVMLFNPEQAHDGMAHDEAGLAYDSRLAHRILSLAHAILGEKEEALCSELLLSLTDSLIQTNHSTYDTQDEPLIYGYLSHLN